MTLWRRIPQLGALSLWVALTACREPQPEWAVLTGSAFGIPYRLEISGHGLSLMKEQDRLRGQLDGELARLTKILSTYLADSEVVRFNHTRRVGVPVPVSPEFSMIVERSLELYYLTGGAFDITVAAMLRLWGFGPGMRPPTSPPSAGRIRSLVSRHSSKKLKVVMDGLVKEEPDLELDLNGITKGFVADRLGDLLQAADYKHFIFTIGAVSLARGKSPEGRPWSVALESRSGVKVQVGAEALAVSGDYTNFYTHAGRKVVDFLDPRNGRPVRHQLVSAAIIASDAATADSLAVTCMVLGEKDGWKLVKRLEGVDASFLIRGKNGNMVAQETEGFRARRAQ